CSQLLVEDHVEHGRQVVAAEAGGPREPEEARVVEGRVPFRLSGPVLVVGRRDRQAGIVLRQPRAEARSEPGLRRRITKVHPPLLGALAATAAAARLRRRTSATRAALGAGTRGPGSPTCSPSRRAPAPRSRTPCARRVRSRPWPRARRRGPRRARGCRRPKTRAARRCTTPPSGSGPP